MLQVMIRTLTLILLCIGLLSAEARAQPGSDLIRGTTKRTIITAEGLNLGVREGDKLVFEAGLASSYEAAFNAFSLVISPVIDLRMFTSEGDSLFKSKPVLTPNFNPQAALYWRNPSTTFAMGLAFAHYSNGQEDPALYENVSCEPEFEDGEENSFCVRGNLINLKTGSFSTNYFELRFPVFRNSTFHMLSFQHHVGMSDFLKGLYPDKRIRWTSKFDSQTVRYFWFPVAVELELEVMLGRMGRPAFHKNRFSASLKYFFGIPGANDLAPFFYFYYGPDYYNIRFRNHRTLLGGGFSVNFFSSN